MIVLTKLVLPVARIHVIAVLVDHDNRIDHHRSCPVPPIPSILPPCSTPRGFVSHVTFAWLHNYSFEIHSEFIHAFIPFRPVVGHPRASSHVSPGSLVGIITLLVLTSTSEHDRRVSTNQGS
jgi:hypothetical protein